MRAAEGLSALFSDIFYKKSAETVRIFGQLRRIDVFIKASSDWDRPRLSEQNLRTERISQRIFS